MTAVLTATFFVCLPAPTLADISLSAQNRIVITEVGSFGTAEGILTELFKQYVLLALEKADLSGSGTEVTFILKSKAEHWHELPKDEVADIRDINAFEIAIRETPQPTVTITGQTPIATGHGVLFFLEKHLGVLWAFPGELGLCLPKERSIQLEAGTESVSPWIIARVMSGLLFRDGTPASHASRAMTGVLRDQRAFFLADDYFNGCLVVITGGTGEGQARLITDYVGSTDTATIDHAWNTNPSSDSTYDIYRIVTRTPLFVDVSAATATPTWDDPSSRGVTCAAEAGEWWLFAAKGGTTDAHDAWLTYQEDNVAA